MPRLVVWQGLDAPRMEAVELRLAPDGLTARGTQLGAGEEPYRADYELDASGGFVTRRLEVRVLTERWRRRLLLTHDGHGGWSWQTEVHGDAGVSGPGAADSLAAALAAARDCDLGFSPLTNTLPVRRLRLADARDGADLVTAWVSVPDLQLHAYPQRYEPLGARRVRFVDRGLSPGFTAELELDADGVVVLYPGLARRAQRSTSS